MTGPVHRPAAQPPETPPPETASPARAAAANISSQTPAPAAQEAVTLSADAPTLAKLFEAARDADGVDHANVERVRVALHDGTFAVAPEVLAVAMIAALKDRPS